MCFPLPYFNNIFFLSVPLKHHSKMSQEYFWQVELPFGFSVTLLRMVAHKELAISPTALGSY